MPAPACARARVWYSCKVVNQTFHRELTLPLDGGGGDGDGGGDGGGGDGGVQTVFHLNQTYTRVKLHTSTHTPRTRA